MAALVSLLLIAVILIDCKITNFSLHLFVYFLVTIIILVNSKVLLKRKNDHDYYFCGCHTH